MSHSDRVTRQEPGRRRSAGLVVAALAIVLTGLVPPSGCAYLSHLGDPGEDELDRTFGAFSKFLLWGEYAKAKLFVVPEDQRAFFSYFLGLEDRLKFSDFRAELVELTEAEGEEPAEGRIHVRLEYARLPSNVYQRARIELVWVIEDGQWMLRFPDDGWGL